MVPLTDASTSSETPAPMVEDPALGHTAELADSAQTRTDAESFALSFAQLQLDTREGRDQAAAVDALASGQLPALVRQFLLEDFADQRAIGTLSHYDPEGEAWLRSQVIGDPAAPERVNVQVAAVIVAEPLDIWGWNTTRVDVVWEDGAWRVADYASSVLGPVNPDQQPKPLKAFLEGDAWRQVQPA